jgi:hypothetical protein
MTLNQERGFFMRHREQIRIFIVIAIVCACIALTIGLATAQDASQPSPIRLVNQQSSGQQKKTPQRRETQPQDASGDSIKITTELVQLDVNVDEEELGGFFNRSPAKKAKQLLTRLAEDSGGRAFFPTDVSEMPAIAAQIAKELRAQYVISYYPSNSRGDGSFRPVRVTVNNRKLIAQTRQGYYARDDLVDNENRCGSPRRIEAVYSLIRRKS